MGMRNWACRLVSKEQWSQAGESGQGGEEDGPEPSRPSCQDRLSERDSGTLFPVDVVDQDQTVVHDHARQGNDAEHGQDAQVHSQNPVAQKGAHQPEGNRAHDDQRLEVGAERNSQQCKDGSQGHTETLQESAYRLALLLLLALQRIAQARKLLQQRGKVVRLQLRQNFVGVGPLSVHLRGHADGAIPSTRRMDAKPRLSSESATTEKGTSPPSGVRIRIPSICPRERRRSEGYRTMILTSSRPR